MDTTTTGIDNAPLRPGAPKTQTANYDRVTGNVSPRQHLASQGVIVPFVTGIDL